MDIPVTSENITSMIQTAQTTATSLFPIVWLIGGMILGFAMVKGLIGVFKSSRQG